MKTSLALACTALCVVSPAHAAAHLGVHEQIANVTRRIQAEAVPKELAVLHLRRGDLQRIHRDWAAAQADFVRAKKLDPALAAVDLSLGEMWLDAGKPKRAKSFLDRFLVKQPRSVKALVVRARVLMQLRDFLAAATDYRRAIKLFRAPKRPIPGYFLGCARALVSVGEEHVDAALRVLDEGLEKLGGVVVLELLAIDLEVKRHRPDAALRRVDRIAAGSRRQENWHARRGEILEDAGRITEALQAYERTLTAIDSLPRHRRKNRATVRLEERVQAAMKRLGRHSGNPIRAEGKK